MLSRLPSCWCCLRERFVHDNGIRTFKRGLCITAAAARGERKRGENGSLITHAYHHSIAENVDALLLKPGRLGFHGIVRASTLP